MNKNYGKLVDGAIEFAPDVIETKYGPIYNPNARNYLLAGWKKVVEGAGFGDFGWYETAEQIIKIRANASWGVLVDTVEGLNSAIEFAPDAFIEDGVVDDDPSDEKYRAKGFKKLVDVAGTDRFLEDDDAVYGVFKNYGYGKLVEGEVEYADDKYELSGEVVVDPDYAAIGFLPVAAEQPPVEEGYKAVAAGWVEEDGAIKRVYDVVPLPPPPEEVKQYSKLAIVVQLKQLGLFDQVKAYIQAAGLYDEYLACQVFKNDNPYFKQGLDAIKAQLSGLTDETVAEVLANAEINGIGL